MKFTLNVKKSDPVLDAAIQVGDMFVQNKEADDRKIYMAAEILGDIKLININNGQTYNKDGYAGLSRRTVLDTISSHFYKYSWTFIPVEKIVTKNVDIVIKD